LGKVEKSAMNKYKPLFEEEKIIGYHQTDYANSIIKKGFDISKIKVAFLGLGFSFSSIPKNNLNKKNILKAEIILKNPLKNYDTWLESAEDLGTSNLFQSSKELTKKLRKLGYDGILAFRKYGWWKSSPSRDDEIIVFNPRNIRNIELYK